MGLGLEGLAAFFTGADADDFDQFGDEDFAVADFAAARGFDNGFERGLVNGVFDDDIEFGFGEEIHGVFAAAESFHVALLPAESLDFGDRHAVDADFGQGGFYFIKFEWFNDGFDFLHILFG